MFVALYFREWVNYFENLPSNEIRIRVVKKIKQLKDGLPSRHLGLGLDFFVEEIGQYRLTFKKSKEENTIIFYFVGDHKEYERWIRKKAPDL